MPKSHPKPTAKKDKSDAEFIRSSFLELLKRAVRTPALKPLAKAK